MGSFVKSVKKKVKKAVKKVKKIVNSPKPFLADNLRGLAV